MNKSNMRTYSNARGDGKLFSVDLIDATGEIRGTFFNEVAEKFFGLLQVDRVCAPSDYFSRFEVYNISRGTLKIANKQYSNLKCDYEITFDNNTTFDLAPDDSSAPRMRYKFVKINELDSVNNNSVIGTSGA